MFPNEIWFEILNYLDPDEREKFLVVNKTLRHVTLSTKLPNYIKQNIGIWKNRFEQFKQNIIGFAYGNGVKDIPNVLLFLNKWRHQKFEQQFIYLLYSQYGIIHKNNKFEYLY